MRKFSVIAMMTTIPFLVFFILAQDSLPLDPNDLWIKTALASVMERDGHFDLDRIDLSTHNGTVKLSGTVLTGDERGLAELLAMQIPGVKAVENDILVIPALDPDIEVEKEAQEVLFESPLLHIRDLKVHTQDGNVTLRGIVYDTGEKRLAGELVAMLPGVNRVNDKIEILRKA